MSGKSVLDRLADKIDRTADDGRSVTADDRKAADAAMGIDPAEREAERERERLRALGVRFH